jgi:amino acid adenylation domain-containing protein
MSKPFRTDPIEPGARRALREVLSQAQQGTQPPLQPTRKPAGNGPLPLSFAQQQLWFLQRWQPDSPVYNFPIAFRLLGRLDVRALEDGLAAVLARHDALRMVCRLVDGQPTQRIEAGPRARLTVTDLTAAPLAERPGRARERMRLEARRPFHLEGERLFRFHLFRLSPDEHWLLLNLHHLVFDGWSAGVLCRELGAGYDARMSGRSAALPPLPVRYADFIGWQHTESQGSAAAQALAYWDRQLSGSPPRLELPADRPRPAARTFDGARRTRLIGQSELVRLKALGREHGATLFMTLLAAFSALLHRYTRQEDLWIGTPVSGRTRPEFEPLIGLFVNPLVLRTRLTGQTRFGQLLDAVRETALDAFEHQELPFSRLVEALRPAREAGSNPFFQTLFVLQNAAPADLRLRDMTIEPLDVETETAKFDLTLTAMETAEGLVTALEYSRDLFEAATIDRMLGHWAALLAGVLTKPDQEIARLPILTPSEQRCLLTEWNGRTADFLVRRCVHQLFEAHADVTPEAVAVECEDRRLTYGELNHQANRLARALRQQGVGPNTLVGLHLERSLELVVAILAVLKAGGAYVPLDPAAPKGRLQFVLQDTRAPVWLTQTSLLPNLPEGARQVICVDQFLAGTHAQSADEAGNPDTDVTPDDLAYVIYTSGSTGNPKGVLVTHRNLVRLFAATRDWFRFDSSDVWTLFHSAAFDFSVWEIWGALIHGGRLIIVPYWVSRDPRAFLTLLTRERVTVLSQTPSAFRQLIEAEASGAAPALALRWVIFGGEALQPSSLKPWFERHGDRQPQLVNMYGITETTVHVTYRPLTAADIDSASVIGIPIPDLEVILLDDHLQPVPVGVVGEIMVGGAGLARGYLNRPELTTARFVPHPFGQAAGERLYRSGDLARRRPNGELEYVGRADDQFKVRGFRLEPGEVEAALRQHPAVRECAVLPREARPGEKQLVAYLVTQPGHRLTTDAWAGFLRSRLPDYAVPAAFVSLDALPLTTNGKLDRQALPAPNPERPELSESFAPPQTEVEEALVEIWREVLDQPRVGVRDSFFALGGHSLLLVRMLARVRDRFQVELSLPEVFKTSTISGIAALIEKAAVDEIQALSDEEARQRAARLG